jgi:hypothetical protein
MSRNLVSAAIDLVDTAPSNEFLSTLHAELLAEFNGSAEPLAATSPHSTASRPELVQDVILLAPNPSPSGPNRRLMKIVLAAAACIALFATAVLIANHPNDDLGTARPLQDVNSQEALPLGRAAFMTADQVGSRWRQKEPFSDSVYESQSAATQAALPDCAMLMSFGLMSPTTKSAVARQSFTLGGDTDFRHTVFVFATPEDASRAMDVIAGKIYPTCWFDLYDRLTPLEPFVNDATISEAWNAPAITPHGDRQLIIGQHARRLSSQFSGSRDTYIVNTYTQVGRAISWINPSYRLNANNPLYPVNKAISAAANALDTAFGK